ncbi:MAG: 3-phosphoshikimate 1-carboxyvinyltransferase [Gammaproteobacteria bacterium]|nr:MAG: 3-phosphoshikimate 1-carboxyvinyltransferase [Gammaproteobacteria bacterium]
MKCLLASPGGRVDGAIRVPGDKSISHRAIMLGAIASGTTRIRGFLPGEDCLATLAAMQAMGVDVVRTGHTEVTLAGAGLRGLRPPAGPLDMGNSGTAMRLLAGLLAGQSFESTLVGDTSLSKRPMERVAQPLREMGAGIETVDGHPPLRILGGAALHGIDYAMPVASAQVKSALLLAGLYASGTTTVREPAVTRDHSERMLAAFGQAVRREGLVVHLEPAGKLEAVPVDVPGDLSSATFLILAAGLAREGSLVIEHVGLNPTRTGILEIFRLMGLDFTVEAQEVAPGAEPVGRITVRPSQLRGAVIPPALVPLAIDEFPAVFVAAALADGETVISGAEELRHKESDRIAVMASGLRALGAGIIETADGARIQGGPLGGGEVDSAGDHRIAMAFAVGASCAQGGVRILDTANVATSFPGFAALAQRIGLRIEETAGSDRPA